MMQGIPPRKSTVFALCNKNLRDDDAESDEGLEMLGM
jgi:hypothetical protein